MTNFDQYWRDIHADVSACDQDWDRQPQNRFVDAHGLRWRLDWIRFSSVENALIQGWYCVPDDHPVSMIGVLWLPGYSYGTSPPDENSLTPGACVMSINVHGNAPDAPYINPAGKNDYIVNGIDNPAHYIYRQIAAHCLRALQVLADQAEVDSRRIAAAGMSQGAALALISAAQEPNVGACFADMPFLSSIERSLQLSGSGAYKAVKQYIAAHPGSEVDVIDTMRLFDPAVHAPRITCPVWLSAGGRDPAVKPGTVEAVYAKLSSAYKEYRLFEDAGHVFVPEMAATRARWLADWGTITAAP